MNKYPDDWANQVVPDRSSQNCRAAISLGVTASVSMPS